MKIAIFISTLEFGGAEKQAVVDAALLAKGHQVFFITFRAGPLKEQLPGEVEFLLLQKSNYFSTARTLARFLKSREIELVHAHLFAPMVISSIASLLCRAKVVWNFHSHAFDNVKTARLAHGLASWLPGVKKILFPANELKEYYRAENHNFPQKKEMIFFNSGQFWEQQPYRESGDEKIIIGFVGRVIPLKRLHLLVRLAEKLKEESIANFEISIVGDGTELQKLKSEAAERNVTDVIRFHGFQSDTNKYYKDFSIFALPSEEEVLSLSLIDAQLTGLPCVAFDVGGNADVVENGRSGFIVQDESAFMGRIRELATDRNLRRQMGRRAIEQSTEKFSQKARVNNLEKLYQSVLSL